MEKLRTHYDNLQVMRTASPEVIKAAYRTLSQKFHPDRNPPEKKERCERVMRLINASYETLSDPARRAEHDRWITAQENQDPTPQPPPRPSQPRPEPRPSSPPPSATMNAGLLTAGSILWKYLPTPAKDAMREAQANSSKDKISVRAYTYAPFVATIFFTSIFLSSLALGAGNHRWSGNDEVTALAWSFTGFLLICSAIVLLIQLGSVAPGRALMVTPTHIVFANLSSVTFWPIAGTKKFYMTMYTRKGSFSRCEIAFEHSLGGGRVFTVYDETRAGYAHTAVHRVLQLIEREPRAYAQALVQSPFSPLTKGGFAGTNYAPSGALAVLAAIVVTAAFHLGWLRPQNLQARVMNGPPPLQAAAEPADASVENLPAPPSARRAPVIDPFEAPPITGWVARPRGRLVAPLVIHTPAGTNYFFKIASLDNQTVGTFFVRGGETVHLQVPLGSFRIRYAYGRDWYGAQYLFSSETAYSELETVMTFTQRGHDVEGAEVTLVKAKDGNLDERAVAPADF